MLLAEDYRTFVSRHRFMPLYVMLILFALNISWLSLLPESQEVPRAQPDAPSLAQLLSRLFRGLRSSAVNKHPGEIISNSAVVKTCRLHD